MPEPEQDYMIRKRGTNSWLATAIDSGGMSVFWVSISQGERFTKEGAESMKARLAERYPSEKVQIISHH